MTSLSPITSIAPFESLGVSKLGKREVYFNGRKEGEV
jgi:hypothetical protein